MPTRSVPNQRQAADSTASPSAVHLIGMTRPRHARPRYRRAPERSHEPQAPGGLEGTSAAAVVARWSSRARSPARAHFRLGQAHAVSDLVAIASSIHAVRRRSLSVAGQPSHLVETATRIAAALGVTADAARRAGRLPRSGRLSSAVSRALRSRSTRTTRASWPTDRSRTAVPHSPVPRSRRRLAGQSARPAALRHPAGPDRRGGPHGSRTLPAGPTRGL